MLATHGEEGLRVLTVNLDRKPEAARRFLEDLRSELPVISDPDGDLAKRFDIQAMPTAFVFDRTGAFRLRHEGFRPKEAKEVEARLIELLESPVPDPNEPSPGTPAPAEAP